MISLSRNISYLLCTFALMQCNYGYGGTVPPSNPVAKELMDYYTTHNPKTIYSPVMNRQFSKDPPPYFKSDAAADSTQERRRNSSDSSDGATEPIYAKVQKSGKKRSQSNDHIYDNVFIAPENNSSSASAPSVPPRNGNKRGPTLIGKSSVSVDSLVDPTYAVLDFSNMRRHKGLSNLDADDTSTSSFEYIAVNPKQRNASPSQSSTEDYRRSSMNTFDALDYPYNYENSVLAFDSESESDKGPRGYDETPLSRKAKHIKNTRDSIRSNKKGTEPPPPPPKPQRTFQHQIKKDKKTDMFHPSNYTQENADVVEMSTGDARIVERRRDRLLKKLRHRKAQPVQPDYSDREPAIEPQYRSTYNEHSYQSSNSYKPEDRSRRSAFKRVFHSKDRRSSPPQEMAYDEVDANMAGKGNNERGIEAGSFIRLRPKSSDSDSSIA